MGTEGHGPPWAPSASRSWQAVEPPTHCSPSHPHLQVEDDVPLPKRRLHPCLKPTISQLCCCWMAEASPWTWLTATQPRGGQHGTGEPCPHGAGHRGRRQVAPPGDVTATAEIPALNTGCKEPAAAARHSSWQLLTQQPPSLPQAQVVRATRGGRLLRQGRFQAAKRQRRQNSPPWGRQLLKVLFYSHTLDLTSSFLTDPTPQITWISPGCPQAAQ